MWWSCHGVMLNFQPRKCCHQPLSDIKNNQGWCPLTKVSSGPHGSSDVSLQFELPGSVLRMSLLMQKMETLIENISTTENIWAEQENTSPSLTPNTLFHTKRNPIELEKVSANFSLSWYTVICLLNVKLVSKEAGWRIGIFIPTWFRSHFSIDKKTRSSSLKLN